MEERDDTYTERGKVQSNSAAQGLRSRPSAVAHKPCLSISEMTDLVVQDDSSSGIQHP